MLKRFLVVLAVMIGLHGGVFAEVDSNQAVSAHNEVRAAVNQGEYAGQPTPDPALPMVMWDQTLADGAAAYAEQCVWAHSDERINVGENLYASTDLSSGIDEGAEMWANEYQFYNFISRSCAPGEQCGHYTQMVWFDSILVGCGDAVCEPLRLPNGSTQYASAVNVVCWYAAAGNLTGHDPYDTDGGNPANTPDYDHSTMKLTMPYMLLWHPDNLVQAYELELSLAAGPSIQFRLDAASRVNYDAMSHVPILDVNSTRLLLPLVDVSIGGVTTQNSLVLQHVPGSADPVLFELTHAQ